MIWAEDYSRFPQVPFGRLFAPLSRRVPPGAAMVTAYTDGKVTLRSNRSKEGYHQAQDMSAHQGVEPGDLVVHGLDILRGSVGVSDSRGAISSVCIVCAPLQEVDPRFVAYAIRAEAFSGLPRAMARGVREGGADFRRWDTLSELPIPYPALDEQRAIADYLDRETARIGALIAAKERMAVLLDERWQGVLEDTIQDLSRRFGIVPLKFVCREIVVGIVITPSAWYADDGVPAIRGTNVEAGTISLNDLVFLTPEGHRLHPKSELRAGDVVVVRTGQAGSAAVVPPELDGANCIDLVIIRLMDRYLPEFLVYVLNSDWMQKHIAQHSVGTIQSHFNVGAASLVSVPRAPKERQAEAVAVLAAEHAHLASIVTCLKQQIALLRERRQALITAAVTGQVQVAVAA